MDGEATGSKGQSQVQAETLISVSSTQSESYLGVRNTKYLANRSSQSGNDIRLAIL